MGERNIWKHTETVCMLNIMINNNVIDKLAKRIYRHDEMFEFIESEMRNNNFFKKSAQHIKTKWKNLKKDFYSAKQNYLKSGISPHSFEFFEEMRTLIGDPAIKLAKEDDPSNGVEEFLNVHKIESVVLPPPQEQTSFITPPKRKFKKQEYMSDMNDEHNYFRETSGSTKSLTKCKEFDEIDLFGKYITQQLRKLSENTALRLQSEFVQTIVMERIKDKRRVREVQEESYENWNEDDCDDQTKNEI